MEFHPCGTCGVHVLETDEAIQCDGLCSLWHHRECLGMTLAEYLKLSKGQEDWFCRKCIIKQEIKQEAEAERRRRQKSEMGKSKIECKKLDVLTGDQKCVFCHQTDIDEMKYGPVYMHKNVITHYYCLLLSSNMEQNGRDCDGILGFLHNDIQKEIKRGVRLYCSYCRSGGATLGCAIAKCKVVFHLPCGMKHGTLHQFFGEFKSFCAKHRPVQKISPKILAESSKNAMCGICYEKVVPRPIHETLWAPCCQKSAFFHRDCVQRLATSAGYFFKCPLCNNTSIFQKEMKEFGIYIPEQDASWECVPNAYQDLLVRHDTCDSVSCSCPSGRKTNNQGTRWELILCKFCGSQGIHIGCGRLKWKSPEFVCLTCSGDNDENSIDHHGNRHRLSGTGRTAEIHPSVSADREGEKSDDDGEVSSDESTKVTLTNRRGRRRVISPPTKITTPPPSPTPAKTHKKSERHGKRTSAAAASTVKVDVACVKEEETVVIDDSDDDVEVVSETRGSCLKTNDGATIPIVQLKDNVKKRLNDEGGLNVVEEVVDITIHMEGPPKKKSPSPPVEEVIYSLPSYTPKPSTSYCAPSTSFTAPPDVTKFVIVDPATFRPEDLPPGTVLYRSFTPMVPVPPTTTPSQPQVQSIPAGQIQMPQLGGTCWRSADAKHPDLSKHRRRSSFHIDAPACHTKKTSRSNECNSSGRRGRGRCDINRLNPRVIVSPLKCRISNGFYEILVPRRNLGFAFGYGSLKRKASPLPSRPAKKIKISTKKSVVKEKKHLKENCPNNSRRLKSSKLASYKRKSESKIENENPEHSQGNKVAPKGTKEKGFNSKCSTHITMFFPQNDSGESKSYVCKSKGDHSKGKENTTPEEKPVAKRSYKKRCPLIEWKCKKIDEYLSKFNTKLTLQSDDFHEKTKLSNENESTITVKLIVDEIIGLVVDKYLLKNHSVTDSDTSDVSSLDKSDGTNPREQSDSTDTDAADKEPDKRNSTIDGYSLDICDKTSTSVESNSSLGTESQVVLKKEQVSEGNHEDIINCQFPALEFTKTESSILYSILASSQNEICETVKDNGISPVTCIVGKTPETLKDCSTIFTPIASAQDPCGESDRNSRVNENCGSGYEINTFPTERMEAVSEGGNASKPHITSNLCVRKEPHKTLSSFPKIKFKSKAQWRNMPKFQSKRKVGAEGESNAGLGKNSKMKENNIDMQPPKLKKLKIEKIGPIRLPKLVTIKTYFSTSEISKQNFSEKVKVTSSTQTSAKKSGNNILNVSLNNEDSPGKRPLAELKFNSSATSDVVKVVQFGDY